MELSQEEILEIKSIYVNYGKIPVLQDVCLYVEKNEIVTLVGPNGAGKTTTLNAIYGVLPILKGKVFFTGQCINGLMPLELVKLGIGYVLQGRRIFPTMTVMDNLILGAYSRHGREEKEKTKEDIRAMFKIFPVLNSRRKQLAGTLSGGEQQMLAIARALMSRPRLLLLDEPSLGLAPLLVNELMRTIAEQREKGLSILLVEQNVRAAFKIANRGYVMEGGIIAKEDTVRQLLSDEAVKVAYLGGK